MLLVGRLPDARTRIHHHCPQNQVLLLDVIPPEKMPARVVPRVGIRSAPVNDTCAPVSTSIATCEEQTATNGSTSGPIDINSPPTAPSVASSPKRGRLNEVTSTKGMKAGHNSSVSGREEGRGSGGRGSVDDGSGGCSGGPMTRSRKKRSRVKSKSEQFFEVSATSQVCSRVFFIHVHRMSLSDEKDNVG